MVCMYRRTSGGQSFNKEGDSERLWRSLRFWWSKFLKRQFSDRRQSNSSSGQAWCTGSVGEASWSWSSWWWRQHSTAVQATSATSMTVLATSKALWPPMAMAMAMWKRRNPENLLWTAWCFCVSRKGFVQREKKISSGWLQGFHLFFRANLVFYEYTPTLFFIFAPFLLLLPLLWVSFYWGNFRSMLIFLEIIVIIIYFLKIFFYNQLW